MSKSFSQKQLEEEAPVTEKKIFSGKVFTVTQETLQFDQLPSHTWDLVRHPGAVAMLPIGPAGKIYLIQQWRRAVKKILYEIPAGTLDEGEDPLTCAHRELQEEIGYKAKELIPLGAFYAAPGYCDELIHLFLAKNLVESSLDGDEDEAIDLAPQTLEEALAKIDSGEIKDAKTILALLRYERWKRAHA